MSGLTRSAAWRALERHAEAMAGVHLRELFAADPDRFARFSLRAGDLLLDYSKNRVTEETIRLLLDLAREGELEVGARACSQATGSTPPRTARFSTSRCATAPIGRS